MVLTAKKMRIYPTAEQEEKLGRFFGCARFTQNQLIAMQKERYANGGKYINTFGMNNLLPALKLEYPWLKATDSKSLQHVSATVNDAYQRFFKGQNRFPRFRKKDDRQSYTTDGNIAIQGKRVKLPKLGTVKIKNHYNLQDSKIKRATISKTTTNKYYVSLLIESQIESLPTTGEAVGIDLGLKDFAILFDGVQGWNVENQHFLKEQSKKLAEAQKILSRRALLASKRGVPLKEAKNYQRQKLIVAKLHEKIANQRKDFLQKLSTELIQRFDIICLENLGTKNMMKNHKLARSISEQGWSQFVSMLQYKKDFYAKKVVQVSRNYPSSQICSECGARYNSDKQGVKWSLAIREWTCTECETRHDRDINAAKNIRIQGLAIV